MKKRKKLELNHILSEIKNGLNPSKICEKYNISKSTLDYSIGKLKKLGCIEKLSYGTWGFIKEVRKQPRVTLGVNSDFSKKEIRGHAFIWNIEFLEERYNWNQIIINYKKRYKKPKLSFKRVCNGKVPRIIFKNRKIWLTNNGLTIYEPLDFFGESAFKVKETAIYELDKLIKELIKELGQKFQYYRFICSREHFAHIKNQMARQFNDKKQKIKVEYEGKYFWIDHSDGENEEETNNTNVSLQAQKYYKSQVKTKFKYTPEVLEESMIKRDRAIQKNAENLDYHSENMRSHISAIKKLGKAVDRLTKTVEKKNVRSKLNLNQTQLDIFK